MTYRISYDDGLATGARGRERVQRTEYFHTEFEALRRARELIEDDDHTLSPCTTAPVTSSPAFCCS